MTGLALVVAGWIGGWLLVWRLPCLTAPESEAGSGRQSAALDCSVIVPARNEERSLPTLLHSLEAQRPPPREIIVVDDRSEDSTRSVATEFPGVTVLAGEPAPPGWTGKTWACWQGARAARGRVLVFVDADVSFGPGALARVVASCEARGGLFSVVPYHRVLRTYEQLSAPFSVIALMGTGAAGLGRRQVHGAFGPCLACRRDDYVALDGHRGVRSAIVEDVALAERFDAAGLPVNVVGGCRLVSYRMYPSGLGQLVEGWSKNMAAGARSVPWGRRLLIAAWVGGSLVSLQLLVQATATRSAATTIAAVATWGGLAVQQRVMLAQLGSFRWWVPALHPLFTLFFVAVFARSAWLTLVRRRVRWRGREVPVGGRGERQVES
ncbi:glycosyltransferase [Rhabdothermincola sp.]|uniref:glycosyltransferase n=1 Tax=Rhabdothermincola sp. TaxID=2820405 RepID=UPI002FE23B8F